jgi:hypothetical protein
LGVDGGARDLDRQPGGQPRSACDVEGLLARLRDAPRHDLPHLARIDAGPLHRLTLHGAEQLGRVHGGEAAVALAERRAHRLDHDDVAVEGSAAGGAER